MALNAQTDIQTLKEAVAAGKMDWSPHHKSALARLLDWAEDRTLTPRALAKKKKKTIKVCYHCREPFYHTDGCLFFETAKRAAREVRRNQRTFVVEGTPGDFDASRA